VYIYRDYAVEDDHLPEDLLEASPELVRCHLKESPDNLARLNQR
jgi:hypothetical protein